MFYQNNLDKNDQDNLPFLCNDNLHNDCWVSFISLQMRCNKKNKQIFL